MCLHWCFLDESRVNLGTAQGLVASSPTSSAGHFGKGVTGHTAMKGSYTKLLGAFGANGSRRSRSVLPQSWLSQLGKGRSDDVVLGEVTKLFQACKSLEEVCRVARSRLQAISPNLSGGLYLANAAGDYLENVMTWGAMEASDQMFAPDDCWALRCGRPHLVDHKDNLVACSHTHVEDGAWHLCLPLMAQGEALGILYFRAQPGGDMARINKNLSSHARMLFYMNFSETLAMALANIRLRESLQHQAIRDPLTGLFNRRYLQETLTREIKRVIRSKEPLTYVAIDIDHFKRYNDTHGHDAGDAVLKTVAEILKNRTRGEDIACRLGGEEFALVYPGMPTEVAVTRVQSILHEVETRGITYRGRPLEPVTVSAGICVYPHHAADLESLLLSADKALYQSKNNGRNRATLADLAGEREAEAPPVKLVHNNVSPFRKRAAG